MYVLVTFPTMHCCVRAYYAANNACATRWNFLYDADPSQGTICALCEGTPMLDLTHHDVARKCTFSLLAANRNWVYRRVRVLRHQVGALERERDREKRD